MSAFTQTLAKTGSRLGLLAAVIAAALAVSGIGASSAFAAETPCTGATNTILGQGSSLQNIAQNNVWIPEAELACPEDEVMYESTGSGKGLAKWGFTGGGMVDPTRDFIGTDDAPTTEQIEAANAAGNGANVLVVPVAQTAIAVIVHPPSGCTLTEITNEDLEKAFSGEALTWTDIGGTGGIACDETLIRVVREEGSGTTFQFKNYLQQIQATPCPGEPEWEDLEEIGANEEPNVNWPECGGMATLPAPGGGPLATTVAGMEGTIGYAALPDAEAHGAETVAVQNGTEGGEPTFAVPGEEGMANCEGAQYAVPANGRSTSMEEGAGTNVNWSRIFGGNPSIGNINPGTYPICTLTYDLAWDNYEQAGFIPSPFTAVKHYLHRILTGGQTAITDSGEGYSALPNGGGPGGVENVLDAALFAMEMINS